MSERDDDELKSSISSAEVTYNGFDGLSQVPEKKAEEEPQSNQRLSDEERGESTTSPLRRFTMAKLPQNQNVVHPSPNKSIKENDG